MDFAVEIHKKNVCLNGGGTWCFGVIRHVQNKLNQPLFWSVFSLWFDSIGNKPMIYNMQHDNR